MKKIVVLIPISLLILLFPACYKPGHSTTEQNSFGYQFDEPKEYCRLDRMDFGFEMYCPEGKIVVEFISPPADQTVTDVLSDTLNNIPESFAYTFSELEGKQSTIVLAELDHQVPIEQDSYPTYIAVFPFGAENIVVAKAFLYKWEFEDQFKPAFRIMIMTLEPAD